MKSTESIEWNGDYVAEERKTPTAVDQMKPVLHTMCYPAPPVPSRAVADFFVNECPVQFVASSLYILFDSDSDSNPRIHTGTELGAVHKARARGQAQCFSKLSLEVA